MRKVSNIFCVILLAAAASGATIKYGSWLDKANADTKTASRVNPYSGDADAVKAGEKLYVQHCSACHGKGAEGRGRTPSLHSPTVMSASPGALYWLLRNGSLRRGMPSWSQLPPEQRWQIVTWMKSLQ
jgi:mono/diheme cytochrome c family protein